MKKKFIILGAGPAGLGAASQLAKRGEFQVTVIEKNTQVGGNAGSFDLDGITVDFGSHRLHPACDPKILSDIQSMLQDDLLDRPRHGRILLQGRWIHFPLKPLDLAFRLPVKFGFGVVKDTITKIINGGTLSYEIENFATVTENGLGKTISHNFYFPYARKIWGIQPDQLSAIQARRRVSAGSIGKMIRKVLNSIPGIKTPGSGRFFYPRQGYGQISRAYYQSALRNGAQVQFGASVKSVRIIEGAKIAVGMQLNGEATEIIADHVWSTIPITALLRCMEPAPGYEILEAASRIDYRAMILIYLVIGQDQFSDFDAHYFPGADTPITRLSEPKNYSDSRLPAGRTVLCAELPCNPDDGWWAMTDDSLGKAICDILSQAGIPITVPVLGVHTRRLRYAYPIYTIGYEQSFNQMDAWIDQVKGVLTFGRQGLFAHDNTHHALYMAYSAVDCLDADGDFDHEKWRAYRKIFESHVVED